MLTAEQLVHIEAQSTSAPSDAVLSATVQGNTTAGLALYRKLVEGDENFFFSPHSIISVLGLAYGGGLFENRAHFAQHSGAVAKQEKHREHGKEKLCDVTAHSTDQPRELHRRFFH